LPTSSILAVLLFSFGIAIGAVVSPGPVSAAIVSQAPRRGWHTGLLVASGHSVLELIMVILIGFGLSTILSGRAIQTAIAILGGLLLVWMGGKMMVDAWKGGVNLPGDGDVEAFKSTRQLIGLGMLATVSNPFWYAWWVTVAAGYLAQARLLGLEAVAAFYVGHISADFAWDTLLSTTMAGGRRWITPSIYRGLIGLCGAFLVYFGAVFLLEGLRAL
jgi:threonine/homoserine/homoserine lactone efflux protein